MRSATTGVLPACPPTLLRTGLAAVALGLVGVLLAPPASAAPAGPAPVTSAGDTAVAAAVVDPTRPAARVVHGPNCTDGFLRVQVTAGSEPVTLTLQYDGAATGPATPVAAGEQVTLEGAEVEWGATMQLAVAVDGPSGAEAPLDLGTYTRPSQEDCDAVTAPPTSPTGTGQPGTSAPTTTQPTTSGPVVPPSTGRPSTSAPTTATPTPTTPAPSSVPSSTAVPSSVPGSSSGAPSSTPGAAGGSSSTSSVSPGSVVTIRGSGFAPGEQVTVSMAGVAAPLATVTADGQGRVEAVVQIPQDVVLGPAVVSLVGTESAASTAVELQVAARDVPGSTGRTPVPLMAAGMALLVVAVGLAAAAARRPRHDDWQPPAGAAG